MHKKNLLAASLPIAAIGLALGTGTVNATNTDSNNRSINWIENIVVIGEKTERTLKDTTSSVSVITGEELRTNQYYRVRDAIGEIPNVVALSGAVANVRGINGNGAAGGFNSISGGANARVSTLIDGVAEPFVADLTGDSGIWDIEQIEVYRGPQSTSNGRNSIGGSIYIKTADPSFDWESAVRVGYRNEEDYRDTALAVSGPIIEDKLAFRISAQYLDAQTITDDTEFETNPADYDLNEVITNRTRAKLLWNVSDSSQLLLTHASNNEQGDSGRTFYSAADPEAYIRTFFRDIETDSDTTSLKFNSKLTDFHSLEILTAYMDYEWGFDSYEPNPEQEQQLSFQEDNITLDAKLNYQSRNKSINSFIGFAYFEREQDILSEGAFAYFGDDESESFAVYGEVDFELTDRINIILGGRFENESQLRDFTLGPISERLDVDENFFLPKFVFQYSLTDLTTLAFSARRGYNSAGGALNFQEQEYYFYGEEFVDTFEFSLRSSSADGKLNLSANVFYNNYDDYQAQNSQRFIINIDNAVTYGVEVEAFYRPVQNLEFKASLGLLDTDIRDAGENFESADGNELNASPDVTANVAFKYWVNDALNFGFSTKYVSEYFGDIENTDERIAGNFTVSRLNANYENDRWLISAYVNNVFDKRAFSTHEPPGRTAPDGFVAIVDPRTVGVSATYKF